MRIQRVDADLYHVPLARPMKDAVHGVMSHFSVVFVTVHTADGAVGMGYTYSVGKFGGTAIRALIRDDLGPQLIGQDPRRIEAIWKSMWWASHYVGRGGLAVFAISAIDTALWDLKAKLAGEPLWRFLGGYDHRVLAYGGGIDFDLTIEQLLGQAQGFLDSGLRAIKMKIGRDSIREEVKRIAALREFVGPEIKLMADVNMRWSVEKALQASRTFAEFDLYWIEEPTIPDDIAGNRRIETEGSIPVATGENLHSIYEFKQMIAEAGISFPDADISNLGGITAWLKVAHIAEAYNRSITTHGIQELHVSLLAAVPNASLLEIHAFRLDEFLLHPLVIKDGYAYASDRPGHGVAIDWEAIAPHRVA